MCAIGAVMKMIEPRVRFNCSKAMRLALNDPTRSMSMTVLKPLNERFSPWTRKLPADPDIGAEVREGARDPQIDPAAASGDKDGFPREEIVRKNVLSNRLRSIHFVVLPHPQPLR